MGKWPQLNNAPITEALLDIRVELPPTVGLEELAHFHELVKATYPKRKTRRTVGGTVELPEDGAPSHSLAVQDRGYLFWSEDNRQVMQARLDGFTFSRLKPYESWDNLRDESKKLWNIFCEGVKPITVTRIAVRYIDRIEIPLPFSDFREWLLTMPQLAPTLPAALSGFLMRLVMPFDDSGTMAIITQSLPEGNHSNHVPLILDIDVSRHEHFDPRSEALWERFEYLRDVKNRVFFESITRKMEELFK